MLDSHVHLHPYPYSEQFGKFCKAKLLPLEMVWFWILVFNATFNNISVISLRSVSLVEETRVPGENHRLVVSN